MWARWEIFGSILCVLIPSTHFSDVTVERAYMVYTILIDGLFDVA